MSSRMLLAAVVLLLPLTACSGSGAPPEPEGAPTASQTQTPSAEPSPTATATKDPCASAERRAARSLWRLWYVGAAVSSSLTGRSAEATRRLRAVTRRTVERVRPACQGTPPTMSAYLRAVRDVGRRPLDDAGLERVMTGWAAWTDRLGLKAGGKRLADLRTCRVALRSIQVSARVWWDWTSTGRVWWVDLAFQNSLRRQLYGETGGFLRVTGLLRDRFGWSSAALSAGPGRHGLAGWGGSSADSLWVRPGASTHRLAPGADVDVHTTADGTVRVEQLEVYFYVPGAGRECYPPVPVTH